MKSLAPNTLVQNRYLVVQLIGKGGMGEVYLAVDQRLGSAVALKRTLFADGDALATAFEREAKTLARLRHPALTKVSDHFTENGMQYLVMEHISGDDLSKRLEQNASPFPLSWVLFWADQLLDALHYLHSHEPPIIHRDIKPQNLKLTTDNHIILLDFGLAKDSIGETRLSSTGNVIAYTPNYASMEQIRGTGTTARSDIYALAATMYQLLSNIVPADALARADKVLNNEPDLVKPLSEVNPDVPSIISAVITKGMNLSAEQRFANAKEMQAALREAYAQFQQGVSAETMAFNAREELPAAALQSSIKTEQFSAPKVSIPVGEKTEVMPVSLSEAPAEISKTPVDFGATVPFVAPFAEKTEPVPVGEKTEVMPVGEKTEVMMPPEVSQPFAENTQSFGDKTQISPIDYGFGDKTQISPVDYPFAAGEKTELISGDAFSSGEQETFIPAKESYKTEVMFDKAEDIASVEEPYSPEATVPLVNYGEQISELPSSETGNYNGVSTNFVDKPKPEIKETPVVTENKAEPMKRGAAAGGGGGSKVLMIVAIVGILGFLGIGAAGAGAYIFMPELFGAAANPTPQPTAEPTAAPTTEPTVAPTAEPTLQADTNTNTGNSTVDLTNTNTGTDNTGDANNKPIIASDKTPRPVTEKTAEPTKPTATQTKPTVTSSKPPVVRTPTPPKPTTKPTVDPGVIK